MISKIKKRANTTEEKAPVEAKKVKKNTEQKLLKKEPSTGKFQKKTNDQKDRKIFKKFPGGKNDKKHVFPKTKNLQKSTYNKSTLIDKAGAPNNTGDKVPRSKLRKDKKELILSKKKGVVSPEAKQMYEKLKCRSTANKGDLAKQLFTLLKKTDSISRVTAHDTTRIVQCMLKYGSQELKQEIANELLPKMRELATTKYGKFCVLRMIKYGTQIMKTNIFKALQGDIARLATNNQSSSIVDYLYTSWANNDQKAHMKQEFYGDIYKNAKDNSVKCLSDAYKNFLNMKDAILSAVKLNLIHAANKKAVANTLIHTILFEYLNECSEKDRNEIVGMFSSMLSGILHTKDGYRAAIMCFLYSQTKDRRAIVKALKTDLEKSCTHEYGHILVMSIINIMDDTKAIKKTIFDPIYSKLESIMNNQWGRKVIGWFVSPGDTEICHPKEISFLDEGLKYSKKDKCIRRKEIMDQIAEPITNAILSNPSFWLSDAHIGLITAVILKKLNGENFKNVAESLVKVVCDPEWTVNSTEKTLKNKETQVKEAEDKAGELISGIEDAGMHIVLKKIIKHDKQRLLEGEPCFGSFVVNALTELTISEWIKRNRACFILLIIFENSSENMELRNNLEKLVKKHKTLLSKQTHVGAEKLLEKLNI